MHPYGELSASPDNVVNKVLSRASHALSFVETVEQLGLELLLTMTSQWPVARFGKPEQAIDALRIAIERNSG